jgi:hypoxanthine phosphoribosyltransferase
VSNGEVGRVGQFEVGEIAATRTGAWRDEPSPDRHDEPATALVVRQQPLPLPWQLVRAVDDFQERDFAHPAELDFARILSFYRIRWSYEPTTFPLAFSDEGRPSEMFTPDFYLPEHRLYIELTTMRQRLVTRKNRKIRRMRELYPNVRIKLLYRRDYDRLVDAYRSANPNGEMCQVGRILFDEQRIHRRIGELAEAIVAGQGTSGTRLLEFGSADGDSLPVCLPIVQTGDAAVPVAVRPRGQRPATGQLGDRPLLILGVDRGSAVFAHHLATALEGRGLAIERDRVILTRHRSPVPERRVRIGRGPRAAVAGRRVLLVADVVSTGLSLAYLTRWLRRRGAADVEICALLDRQPARLVEVPVRYAGFDAPNELLVGFGLHLRRQFRNLPYIASLVTAPAGDEAGG